MKRRVFNYEEMITSMQKLYNQNEELEELLGDMKALEMEELAGSIRELEEMIAGNEESIEQVRSLKDNVFGQGGNASYLDFFQRMKGRHEQLKDLQRRAQLLSEQCVVREVSVKGFESTIQEFNKAIDLKSLAVYEQKEITAAEVLSLIQLGYSEENILEILEKLETEEDKKMFRLIASKQYEEAFMIDHNQISLNMYLFLSDYEIKLMEHGIGDRENSSDDNLSDLENFVNALFSTGDGSPYFGSANTTAEYVNNGMNIQSNQYHHMMAMQSAMDLQSLIDNQGITADTDPKVVEQLRKDYLNRNSIKILNSAILYKMLENKSSAINGKGYTYDYKISGIDIKLDATFFPTTGEVNFYIDGKTINSMNYHGTIDEKNLDLQCQTDLITSRMGLDAAELKNNLEAIQKQKDELFQNMIFSALVLGATCWNPGAGAGAGVLSSIFQGDGEGAVKGSYGAWMKEMGYNRDSNGRFISNPYKKWDQKNSAKALAAIDTVFAAGNYFSYDVNASEDSEIRGFFDKYMKPNCGAIILDKKENSEILYADYFDPYTTFNLKRVEKYGLVDAEIYQLYEGESLDDIISEIEKEKYKISKESRKLLKKLFKGGYQFNDLKNADGSYNKTEVEKLRKALLALDKVSKHPNIVFHYE